MPKPDLSSPSGKGARGLKRKAPAAAHRGAVDAPTEHREAPELRVASGGRGQIHLFLCAPRIDRFTLGS